MDAPERDERAGLVGAAVPPGLQGLPALYRRRFSEADRRRKAALWRMLCEQFLQRYVRPTDTALDLGAGYGDFINNIRCAKKYAVDLNDDTAGALDRDVVFLKRPAWQLDELTGDSVDVAFASNFFEHLATKDDLLATLRELRRVLRPRGRLLVLQPNIRYAYREYWDFFDHYLPLSHESLTEALELSGFRVVELRPRFLPYTTKSRLPQPAWLLYIYLRLRPLHRLFGKQMFVVAEKPAGEP